MAQYLATKGDSFGRNDLTGGWLRRLPDYHWLKGALKEIRRVDLAGGKRSFNRGSVEWAYQISLDQLNEKDQ
jgi:hypothetical protein